MRVLTWNLMHGRSLPGAGRDLLEDFSRALAGWPWQVALLQEVPPWWPPRLAQRLRAEERHVLTSRNALLPLRRAIAIRWPDLIKSNGGGCNAILVRDGLKIAEHRARRVRAVPERRWLQAVRLEEPNPVWLGNLHAGGSTREASRAAETMLEWCGRAPCALGGDFNLRSPSLPGFEPAGGEASDHVLVHELVVEEPLEVLDRGPLSDHAPLLVAVGSRAA